MIEPDIKPAAEKQQVQVIARAAAILRSLEGEPNGLSLGQIAGRVDLARSTVQRIVAALETEKLLMAVSRNGRVRLGPAIQRLSSSVEMDFVAIARPALVELSAELRETVDFAVIRKDHLIFIDQVVGPERLRTVSAIGETFPLYCTANGKAHLARLADAEIVKLIGRSYPARTPATLTDYDALMRDIEQIRLRGVGFDREEHSPDIRAAGVALADILGNPVAISVPVPSARFQGREDVIATALLRTKRTLEAQLTNAAT